ncbi:hypothetical protein [Actinoplanes couchii]|uniref:Lipoprotein n=1 Tax=Actinoplanes couchii TaxID=403638 RepID=A0ABQ3X283_9ACTN|nr:hypothetical protein [Actinoplanes couchii]MDR6322396.1 hypothetical protein [Actinoplanes couchii]GID52629.1 hypothetical protein Aco03nite_010330 [Actinoplanes couchii]
MTFRGLTGAAMVMVLATAGAACDHDDGADGGGGEPATVPVVGARSSAATAVGGRSSAALEVHAAWSSCAEEPSVRFGDEAGAELLTLPLLDSAYQASAVVFCRQRPAEDGKPAGDGGGGLRLVVREERTGYVTALVRAMRTPDETAAGTPGLAGGAVPAQCDLVKVDVPWIAVVGADGGWVHPGLPRDTCGSVPHAVMAEIRGALLHSTVIPDRGPPPTRKTG